MTSLHRPGSLGVSLHLAGCWWLEGGGPREKDLPFREAQRCPSQAEVSLRSHPRAPCTPVRCSSPPHAPSRRRQRVSARPLARCARTTHRSCTWPAGTTLTRSRHALVNRKDSTWEAARHLRSKCRRAPGSGRTRTACATPHLISTPPAVCLPSQADADKMTNALTVVGGVMFAGILAILFYLLGNQP